MMQSRLADLARRSSWALSSVRYGFTLQRGFCSATRTRTADPNIHSGELEDGPDVHKGQASGTSTNRNATSDNLAKTEHIPRKDEENFRPPKSPIEPSPKLKSVGVNDPLDPNIQQKRNETSKAIEKVNCVGVDGGPWPEEAESSNKEKAQDNREYYKDHKASPLSELEFKDTRKPVSRYKDRTADAGRGVDVVGWLPEQLDTAEDSLKRATEIWRQNAMRGDPDAPHSRVLRALRGEDF